MGVAQDPKKEAQHPKLLLTQAHLPIWNKQLQNLVVVLGALKGESEKIKPSTCPIWGVKQYFCIKVGP